MLNCLLVSGKVTARRKKKKWRNILSCLFLSLQMLLACEQPVSPVEVEIVFKPFPSAADVDAYTVTCWTASERLVRAPLPMARCWRMMCSRMNPSVLCVKLHAELLDRRACSPVCRAALRLVEDPRGYSVTLGARRGDAALEEKAFRFGERLVSLGAAARMKNERQM